MERFSGVKYACGFSVLGFPCNQFGYQEPGTNQEILNGLKYVRPGNGFQPSFPFFEKVEVNGDKEDRIYTFLKFRCPLPGGVISNDPTKIPWTPVRNNDISWNFGKVLVDYNGIPFKRYLPRVEPLSSEVVYDILRLMEACEDREVEMWQ